MNKTYTNLNPFQVVVLRMEYKYIISYSYLIIDLDNNQTVIVDPAWDMKKIDQVLLNTGTKLSGILLTHSHYDHVNLAKPLASKYNCPIWMSNEEITTSGFNAQQLISIDQMIPWFIGSMCIQPIFTPGHTLGGTCYLIGDNLFTGDTLFVEGCGICPNIKAAHAMFESLEFLKKNINPDTDVFPGHSYGKPPGQKFSFLLMNNIYLQFKSRDDLATFRLRNRQGKFDLFNFY